MASDDEALLEARLFEDPSDVEAWKVYADVLQKRGDPRGTLIVLQHAVAAEKAAKGKRKGPAELALRKHVAKHAKSLWGELIHFVEDDKDLSQPTVLWRNGFLYRIELDTEKVGGHGAGALLERVLAHPSARFIGEIAIRGEARDAAALLAALERHVPRALEELDLQFVAELDVRPWWPHLQRLQRFALSAHSYDVREIALPAVRRLKLASVTLEPRSMAAVSAAPWPVLERLDIRLGTRETFANFEDVLPLLRRTDLPALSHLKLRHASFAGGILRALAQNALGAQLEVIDLSYGETTPQDIAFLAAHKQAFTKLRELWLPAASLVGNTLKQLDGIAKHIVSDSRAPLDKLEIEMSQVARDHAERFEGILE